MPDRPAGRGRLVLDTHVWIWAVEGVTAKLGARAVSAIEEAARASTLAVSAISAWKLAMLVKRQQLTLATAVSTWIEASLRPPGARIIPVAPPSPSIAPSFRISITTRTRPTASSWRPHAGTAPCSPATNRCWRGPARTST